MHEQLGKSWEEGENDKDSVLPISVSQWLLLLLPSALHRDPNAASSLKSPLGCGDSRKNPQQAVGSAFLRLPWLSDVLSSVSRS